MKFLILSNFYPPHHIGGSELLCQEVVEALEKRGHTSVILTSTFGVNKTTIESNVYRLLTLESGLNYYKIREAWLYPFRKAQNIRYLRQLVETIQPDVIFVWGMWSLSKDLAAETERMLGSRVLYYLANPWPIQTNMHQAYWNNPAKSSLGKITKAILRIPMQLLLKNEWNNIYINFAHAPCCSLALRNQLIDSGIKLAEAPIIYEGINLERYFEYSTRNHDTQNLSLLYVGILAPHKGVHTAIEAIANLEPTQQRRISLTILGKGHPQYKSHLLELVDKYHLSDTVMFTNPIPREELPEFLGRFDILLLPSIWEEPLALIMQESLASGLVVIGSATGGTKEIIVDGENGLTFPAEDFLTLRDKIDLLLNDPLLGRKLAESGQRTAKEKFDLVRMVDDIEAYLYKIVNEESLPN
jgi:glycosyltransferase involved in cell wall biosynthesis